MISGYLACSFDLFNVADLDVIDQARQLCDRLIAGIYSDDYVEQLTGRPAVVPFEERFRLVERVRGISSVIAHQGFGPTDHLHKIFVVDGETAGGTTPATAIRLVPRRTTASRQVRDALAPVIRRGVA